MQLKLHYVCTVEREKSEKPAGLQIYIVNERSSGGDRGIPLTPIARTRDVLCA